MIYRFGQFALNPELRVLYRGGEPVVLTGKCLETLVALIRHRGQVVSKDELLAALWPDTAVEEANLTQNVFTLRKALGDDPKQHRYIATVSGRGYSFVAPVTEVQGQEIPCATTVPGSPNSRPHRYLWSGAFAVVLVSMSVLWAMWRGASGRSGSGLSEPKSLPLTSLRGSEYMPAFSPDGKQIAFVWSGNEGSDSQICVKLIDAGTQLRLTNLPGPVSFPAWSPNSQFVAYAREATSASGYYIVSAIGGPERQIAKMSRSGSGGLDWFPDGKHLVVSQIPEGVRASPLLTLAVDTGEQHVLTVPPAGSVGDLSPTISPDGKKLAFVRMTGSGVADMYVMSLDGGHLRRLTSDGTRFGGISWMPDSREIIFSSARNGSYGLWRVPVTGGTPRLVIAGAERAFWPTVARQGDRLAYMSSSDSDSLWHTSITGPKTSPIRSGKRVITSSRRQYDPQYSPDGGKIAYSSNRSGSDEIWVSDADGRTAMQLTRLGRPHTGSPHWSPDGTRIAFDSRPNGNPDIFVVGADGGVPRRITTYAGDDVTPSWSRDEKSIYFASDRSGEFQIWKVAVGGESISVRPVQLTQGGGFAPIESRDGKYLYFAKGLGKPGLWRLELNGTANSREQPVLESLKHWGWWALGKEGIYFFDAQPLGSLGIYFDVQPPPQAKVTLNYLDLRTGSSMELATLDRATSTCTRVLTLSPNGRSLVYEELEQEGSDIMMIEDFSSAAN
jgi:Tol biopolymer transport system component/DNA-binding winged helix-turn-helix (wHTH) protein